jgi:hypothetical protein
VAVGSVLFSVHVCRSWTVGFGEVRLLLFYVK